MGRNSYFLFTFGLITLLTFSPTLVSSDVSQAQHDKYVKELSDAVLPYREHIQEQWTRQETPPTVAASESDATSLVTCGLCTAVLPIIRTIARNVGDGIAKTVAVAVCNQLDLAPAARRGDICTKIINTYASQVLFIIRNTKGTQVCGFIAPDCESQIPGLGNWKIDLPGNKPNDEQINEIRGAVPKNISLTKVLQFTDIHMDLHYKEGGNADCGRGIPICCREGDGPPVNENMRAGKFGHWNCALPLGTITEMFKHAKSSHSDAKYLFMTGDYVHSGVWLYSKEENKEHISAVFQALKDVYRLVPRNQTKIYPLTGNHEPHVVNMYPPPSLWTVQNGAFDLKWMYEATIKSLLERDPDLLPQVEIDRYLKWGYYVAMPEPGMRLLAINTNLGYNENFWIGYSPVDPGGQLQWMADELAEAEERGDKVIIIGHEEPGSTWKVWSGKYNQIVSRYEAIIVGQFYGHSHKPQYRLSFRKGTLTPATTSVITGSALTDGMNPGYGIFYFDGDRDDKNTWKLMRQELVTLNLGDSNKAGSPVFKVLVNSTKDFGMEDLTPGSVFDFAKRLVCDQNLMDKYVEFHHKGKDSYSHSQCLITDSCMEEYLCTLVGSNADDSDPCAYMKTMLKANNCESGARGNLRLGQFYYALIALLGILWFLR